MLKTTSRFTSCLDPSAMESKLHSDPKAVSYQADKDGPLENFKTSTKVRAIQRQYGEGTKKLQNFLKEQHSRENNPSASQAKLDEQINAFNMFNERVQEGETGFFSTKIVELYGPGKSSFDLMCANLENDAIPLQVRVSQVKNLSEGVTQCSGGAVSNLMMAATDLRLSTGGIQNNAKKYWEQMLNQTLQEFSQTEHQKETNYLGNEIHYVNGYRNHLAATYGIEKRVDSFIPPLFSKAEDPALKDKLNRCAAYVEPRVTANQLVLRMAETCLAEIKEHEPFKSYWGRALNEDEVDTFCEEYSEKFEAALSSQYGKIGARAWLDGHDAQCTLDQPYMLIDDPTLLMHAIGKTLRHAGALERCEQPFVHGKKRAERAIKQVGDAYYVKARQLGTVEYWSLRLEDLPDGENKPEMMKAALDNTRDERTLKDYDPQKVWHMLEGNPAPMGWLEQLSTLAVQRFRKASPEHEAFLSDRAFEKVREYSQNERQKAFIQALKQQEDKLALRFSESIDHVDQADESGHTLLHHAARHGFLAPLEAIAKKSKNINARNVSDQTALMLAAYFGHADAITALSDAGANVNEEDSEGWSVLMLAAARGHVGAIAALSDAGANINQKNSDGRTALIMAAANDQVGAITALLNAGANLNEKDVEGWSALMMAAANGYVGAITALLDAGANLNQKNSENKTALMLAAAKGHVGAITALLDAGANLNEKDSRGRNALMVAAEKGHVGVITALLDAGANVNQKNLDGRNALMMAALDGHVGAITALLDAGANIEEKDGLTGMTALKLAKHSRDADAIAVLKKAARQKKADANANKKGIYSLFARIRRFF